MLAVRMRGVPFGGCLGVLLVEDPVSKFGESRFGSRPAKTAPFLPIEDTQCCHGKVSIPADLLDAYQDIPYGTPAHDKSYGRRNPVEKTFSMIKDKGGLKAESVPAFGLPTHIIDVRALAIAHNVKETIGIESTQTGTPKPLNAPKTPNTTRQAQEMPENRQKEEKNGPNWPTYLR